MGNYKIEDVRAYYESYQIKINGEWYFVTKEKLFGLIIGKSIKGEIVKKRTRTWVE